VRPPGAAHGDQARAVTPAEAIAAGSTHLVVGRPITGAENPSEQAEKIIREIEHASPVGTS
jgi:orotidine-5'-phosphate decarboxylase